MLTRGYSIVSRSLFALFFLFCSLFCLIAYVPFTYQQVIKAGLIPQLNTFARIEHWIYWVILLQIAPLLKFRGSRSLHWFWIVLGAAGLAQTIHPVLPRLENNAGSFWWSLACMAPVLWISQLTWSRHFPYVRWGGASEEDRAEQDRRAFVASWQSALFLTIVYAVIAWAGRLDSHWKFAPEAFGFTVSALSHFLTFLFFFVILNLLSVLATWGPKPLLTHFALCHLLGAAVMWLVFRTIVFSAMSFSGAAATTYGIAFSLTVTVFLSGICITRAAMARTPVKSGLNLAFWMAKEPNRSFLRNLIGIVVLAAMAWVLLVNSARMDWNYLVRKLTVAVIWLAAFRMFYVAYRKPLDAPSRTGRMLVCALMILPSYRMYEATRKFFWAHIDKKVTVAQFLDRWAGYDVSFKLIHDALAPDVADEGFYRFLIQNTNISRATNVAPVPVDFQNPLSGTPAKKPNIFMITVDSMRRDYLSPYNSDVDFTPAVGRFAKESFVMENAFTHYGGTGLSEPSIWVGGMLLHKQYVTPFEPMNALEKLLKAENYHAYVSRDTILETVVSPWENLTELDQGRGTMDYDLCTSLEEAESKITSDTSGAPLFLYTQPQNLHISVITRQGGQPVSNENYHSFYAPYASRLRRIDACFGKFIQTLKDRGIYDSSIVVLTADHGDSLGEQGRWGHAYTIYPEIVRIPLIMHIPQAFRENLQADTKALAFSTDITPTLYYILGHKPANLGELFGKSLVVEHEEERKAWVHDSYLVASSYAAVYGILSGDGLKLSVSDGVGYKDYGFNLSSSSTDSSTLSGSAKTSNEELIRKKILLLDKLYAFHPPETSGAVKPH